MSWVATGQFSGVADESVHWHCCDPAWTWYVCLLWMQAFVDCASEDGTSKVPVGVMTIDRHDAVLPQRIKKKQEELSMWSYGAGVQYGAHSSMADEGGEAAGDESLSSEEDTQGDQEEQTEVPGALTITAF